MVRPKKPFLCRRQLDRAYESLVGPKRALYGLIELGIGLRDLGMYGLRKLGRTRESLVGPKKAWYGLIELGMD